MGCTAFLLGSSLPSPDDYGIRADEMVLASNHLVLRCFVCGKKYLTKSILYSLDPTIMVSFSALQECTRVSAKLGENRMWQRTVTRGLAVSTGALVDKLRI